MDAGADAAAVDAPDSRRPVMSVFLPRRSLLGTDSRVRVSRSHPHGIVVVVFTDDAYTKYLHCIPERTHDVLDESVVRCERFA